MTGFEIIDLDGHFRCIHKRRSYDLEDPRISFYPYDSNLVRRFLLSVKKRKTRDWSDSEKMTKLQFEDRLKNEITG